MPIKTSRDLAAVDQQILAGDEPGVDGAEERHVGCDLVGFAVAAGPLLPDRFEAAPPPAVKPSPLLGERVEDVLGSWLGMEAKEIAALRQDGTVGPRTEAKSAAA